MTSFLAEGLAVFLGVYLSFRVAAFQEHRSERKTVRRALIGIRSDLASELPAVEWLIKIYGPVSDAALRLYHDWRRLPEISERAEAIFHALHLGAPYSPARAHYETVKSTGTLGLIDDEELRSAIGAVFEQEQGYIRGISQFSVDFDFEFFRRLRPYIEYGEEVTDETVDSYVVPGEIPLLGPVSLLRGAAEELKEDDITRNSLYIMGIFGRLLAQLLENYAQDVAELDSRISQVLSDDFGVSESGTPTKPVRHSTEETP